MIFKYNRLAAEPIFDNVPHAVAKHLRYEEAAIKQNGVDSVLCGWRILQEFRQMPRDSGIRDIGKSKLAEDALLLLLGFGVELTGRKKATESDLQNFVTSNGRPECAAHERRACARDRNFS